MLPCPRPAQPQSRFLLEFAPCIRHLPGMHARREAELVFAEMVRLRAAGRRCALATLLRIRGSAYRRAGARLLLRDDGTWLGNVSGGCLEADLRERAGRVMQTGQPEAVHYTTGGDDRPWGLGLGCNGELDLWLEAAPRADTDSVLAALRGEEPVTIAAGPASHTLDAPLHLLIVGAGDDSVPLARLAAECGFRVWVFDHRRDGLTPARFADAWRLQQTRPERALADLPPGERLFAVVKNHHLELDRAWARVFADAGARYLGLLGPRARREEICASLPPAALPSVHGPAGLDLGAEGPEQIAASIVAELLAVAAGRHGGFLRERAGGLHAS